MKERGKYIMEDTLYAKIKNYSNERYVEKLDEDYVFCPLNKNSLKDFNIKDGFMVFSKQEFDSENEKYKVKFKKDFYPMHRFYAKYELDKEFEKKLVFILFNPSTANPQALDDTIKNCLILANNEKYSEVEVINLFSYRNSSVTTECRNNNQINKTFILELLKHRTQNDIVLGWGVGKENPNHHLHNDIDDIIKKISEIDLEKKKVISINTDTITKYSHHPNPQVWRSLGPFEKIAILSDYTGA